MEWSEEFPLSGKEVLGLRMYLFSTLIAQLVFTFKSKFSNGIGLQMVENVPFFLELARIVIEEQGHGRSALSTLFFIFGLSSLIVGSVFYLLGKMSMGKIVYFFPSHVLVGCIGGIGVFIITTALEVSTNATFHFTMEGIENCIIKHFHLLLPVIMFELLLRLLMYATMQKYPLLTPIYYCLITPAFYLMLWGFDVGYDGYFFPPLASSSGSVVSQDLLDMFKVIDMTTISYRAVVRSLPTILSLTAFSLIHVPINIPAFAISTNVEPDMNCELMAHGYSNFLAGIFGGLQNYMTYSNSVIYAKANGNGVWSSLGIVATTSLLFCQGPTLASYVPRCMAGTLLLHVGIDLFVEGVYESFHDYDRLEYSGIWLITIVMCLFGMEAALIAGIIAALSTYAVQSITYQYPIRGAMSAARLRSSAWNRSAEAESILVDKQKGRQRIYVFQMQGHIFFGNATTFSDDVKASLMQKRGTDCQPLVVILDFTPVLGIDSSAAQTIAKLKDAISNKFDVVVIFVTGNEEGFPCTYNLTQKVSSSNKQLLQPNDIDDDDPIVFEHGECLDDNMSIGDSLASRALHLTASKHVHKCNVIEEIPNSRVCSTLDDALVFAEDVLIAIEDPHVLQNDVNERFRYSQRSSSSQSFSKSAEASGVKLYLESLCPNASADDINKLSTLLSREKYNYGDVIWEQGDTSDCLKLLLSGSLISLLEDEHGATETIHPGSTIGELGLVNGTFRLTTVKVLSGEAVLYNLSKENWEHLANSDPRIARFIDLLVVRYLSHRVQHVSNRILDKRSLPV